MKHLIVIDCQNDFITGSLACHQAPEAVNHIIDFINNEGVTDVFYSLDWHSPTNKSFKDNGGIWPVHCVANEQGSALSDKFSREIKNRKLAPNVTNKYMKGQNDEIEEYSAFYATNKDGQILFEQVAKDVIIAGIASEYCVMETVKELLKAGHRVSVLKNGLGFVDQDTHQEALRKYDELGITWL